VVAGGVPSALAARCIVAAFGGGEIVDSAVGICSGQLSSCCPGHMPLRRLVQLVVIDLSFAIVSIHNAAERVARVLASAPTASFGCGGVPAGGRGMRGECILPPREVFGIRYFIFGISYSVFHIRYFIFGISYSVFHIRYFIFGISLSL
jgi:hypothetical protein